jgi:hypothetical protein
MTAISPISSTLYQPIYVAPVIPATAAIQPSDAVLNTVTRVNANGTITKITTFVNGRIDTQTTIDPNAPPAVGPNGYGLIAGYNPAQAGILLNAQAQISIALIGS